MVRPRLNNLHAHRTCGARQPALGGLICQQAVAKRRHARNDMTIVTATKAGPARLRGGK